MPDEQYEKQKEDYDKKADEIRTRTTEEARTKEDEARKVLNEARQKLDAAEAESTRLRQVLDAKDDRGTDEERNAYDAAVAKTSEADKEHADATIAFDEAHEATVKARSEVHVELDALNASMGPDYWTTHYEKDPAAFQATMNQLRGSWMHIGGMPNKIDPIAFRFATETAFGLAGTGVAYDKKEGRSSSAPSTRSVKE